jgi:hypothetical protein
MTPDDAVVDVLLDQQHCFLPLYCVAMDGLENHLLRFSDVTLDCSILLWEVGDDATVLKAELPT